MALLIRLFDTNGARLLHTESLLRNTLRLHRVDATVETVACHLEIGRQGLTGREPVLQVNGYMVSAGCVITEEQLDNVCQRLAAWQSSAAHPAPEDAP